MKNLIILFTALLGSASFAHHHTAKQFKVTIQNLTTGQPITPVVISVHNPKYKLFEVGSVASEGISNVARDGDATQLESELTYERKVIRFARGTGVIPPAANEEVIVEANNPHYQLSVVAMLARTNDAIVAKKHLPLNLRVGQKYSSFAQVYDAGVELNTEQCSDIPAPPCGNPGAGTEEAGVIIPHAGVLGIGDLNLSRDSFASIGAKITVERLR